MKKSLMIFVLGVLLIGLVLAAQGNGNSVVSGNNAVQNNEENQESNLGENNQIQDMISNKLMAGEYETENGKKLKIQLKDNNKIQLRVRNVSADCDCNLTQEKVQNKTKLKMQLSNGINSEIKIMPDVASETALARLRLRVCNESNNCTLQLKEVGNGEKTKAIYEIQIERHSRILGIFQAKMQNRVQVDAENGEVIQAKKPWWAFLATEPEEEISVD
ncbi:MAG: hypothetical protein WC438_03655 [Candidatus Pacearchaeota archaeon]